jgi:hypothetical protein
MSWNEADPEVARSVDRLVTLAGDSLWGIVFFGSRLVRTSPDSRSAADLFVIVRDYREFYRRFAPAASVRGAGTLTFLNRWLAPNILSYRPGDDSAVCKLFVVDRRGFARGTGPRAKDHFFRGRLSQRVEVVRAADDEARLELENGIDEARRSTLGWALLECPPELDVLTYCERMLSRSYRGEIRPESPERVREVFHAQRDFWVATYGPILGSSADLAPEGDRFRIVGPLTASRSLRWNLYFRRSRVRATLRWSKYMLTFDGWLDYIVGKVERRTGQTVELTDRERKWPLVFLWPKAWRVLRGREVSPR